MFHGTTVIIVRKNNEVVIAGDGQVTLNHTIIKGSANKLRKLNNGKIIAGFAGSTSDAFLLFDMFENKLNHNGGQLTRSAVELAKDWRSDKILRKLEALLLVANLKKTFLISGSGDVLEPDSEVHAIGSGGGYAMAAGSALLNNSELSAYEIAEKSMIIASNMCIYTNNNFKFEQLN
jgi:ATP-dependent HslUV protease subunit HslV